MTSAGSRDPWAQAARINHQTPHGFFHDVLKVSRARPKSFALEVVRLGGAIETTRHIADGPRSFARSIAILAGIQSRSLVRNSGGGSRRLLPLTLPPRDNHLVWAVAAAGKARAIYQTELKAAFVLQRGRSQGACRMSWGYPDLYQLTT